MARGLPRKISKRNELHSRRSQEFYNSGGSGTNSLSSSNANSADNLNTAADSCTAEGGQDQQQSLQPQGAALDSASQSTTPVPLRKKGKKARGNRSQEALSDANGASQDASDEAKVPEGPRNAKATTDGDGVQVDTMQILSAIDNIIGSGSASTLVANGGNNRTPSPRTRLPPIDHLSASASTPSSGKPRKSTRSRSPSPDPRALEPNADVCHLDMNANDPLFFSAPNPRISPRSTHQAWVQIAPNASTSPSIGALDKSLPGTWVSSTEGLNSNSYSSKPVIPAPAVDIQVIPVTDILPDDSTTTSNDDISSMINEPPHSPQSMLSSRATSPAISASEVLSTVTEPATSPKPTVTSVTSSSSVSPTTQFDQGPLSPPPTPAVVQDMFKGKPAKEVDESGQVSSPVDGPGTPPPTPFTTTGPQCVASASPKVDAVDEFEAASSPVNQGPGTPPPTPSAAAPAATAAKKPSNPVNGINSAPILQPVPASLLPTTHHSPSGSLGLAATPESMEQLGVTFAQPLQAPIPTPLHSHDFAFKPLSPSPPPATSAYALAAPATQKSTSRSPSPSSTALILHPGNSPKSRSLSSSPPPATRSRQTSVTLGLSGTMLRHTLLLPASSTSPSASPVIKVRSGPSM